MNPRLSVVQKMFAGLLALQLAYAGWMFRLGPTGPIPQHFGTGGLVDVWTDRTGHAAFVMGIAIVGLIVNGYLTVRVSGQKDPAKARRLAGGQWVLVLVFAAVTLLAVYIGSGAADHGLNLGALMGPMGLVVAGVGGVMGRIGPNHVVGVRTPWSFKSQIAWERSNRLLGRLWFWTGLAGAVASFFAPQPAAFQIFVGALIAGALLAAVESWRVWRTDPDRKPF